MLEFECELNQVVSFGQQEGSGTLILGEIKCINIEESVYQDGYVDFGKLEPVGRLAGNWYSTFATGLN